MPSRTSESKPASWPAYLYGGPVLFDVCATATYPFDSLLSVDMEPIGASASGYAIDSVQQALLSLNYNFVPQPSYSGYDSATAAAVQRFQSNKGLISDGTVGPQTWKALHFWVNYYEGNCP